MIILNNIIILNLMKNWFSIIILIIKSIIYKYLKKFIDYIKLIFKRKILADILIKNINLH